METWIGYNRSHAGATTTDETPGPARRPVRGPSAHSVLNRNKNPKLPFHWTLNPYRGCEFGCRYCYARTTHEYLDVAGEDFERRIFVKQGAAEILRATLRPGLLAGKAVAIGTATDPYQAAEIRYGVTRSLLEVLAQAPDLTLAITTKSPLVVRDIDLLTEIGRRRPVRVNMTITTLDAGLAREIEHRAPSPRRRLEAVRQLSEAGVETALFCCPILPGLTDEERALRALLRAAHSAGAAFAVGSLLHLEDVPKRVWFRWLERRYPELVARYRRTYAEDRYGTRDERERVHGLFARLANEVGFPAWMPVSSREKEFVGRTVGEQARLF
ncbi:MAG: radical SAM protein [Candidatus Eisenbacteria bacterium]